MSIHETSSCQCRSELGLEDASRSSPPLLRLAASLFLPPSLPPGAFRSTHPSQSLPVRPSQGPPKLSDKALQGSGGSSWTGRLPPQASSLPRTLCSRHAAGLLPQTRQALPAAAFAASPWDHTLLTSAQPMPHTPGLPSERS